MMMFKCLWLIAAAALIFHSSVEAGFVDDLNPDADVPGHGLGDRHLLQMDSSSSSQLQQTTGPERFFDGKEFLMTVKSGIILHVFDARTGGKVDEVALDREAVSVVGSETGESQYGVNIDWKTATFMGKKGKVELQGILINLNFEMKNKEYELRKLEADQLVIGTANIRDVQFKVESRSGYSVSAPIGTSFCCGNAGVFMSKKTGAPDEDFKFGLSFPDIQLQVFEVGRDGKFGAAWECGELMGIGLWIGLLITLFFALVCFWGFSMLANIQTMDRFDDPKGKPIHVPQTE